MLGRGAWWAWARTRAAPMAAAAAGLGLFLLYLLSFPDVRSDAYVLIDDGVWYMRMVEAGNLVWLLHPHHLLYHLQPFALYKLLLQWWPSPLATLWAHRLVDAAYGAAGILLFWRAALRIAGDRWAAGLAAAGLAASASYWFHAGLPENAIAGAFGLILVLWALARALERPASGGAWLAVGLAHAFAVLMRKDGVLAAPLVLCALLAAARGRGRLRAAAAYLAPLGAAVAAAYAVAYLVVVRPALGPEANFLRWLGKNAVAGDWGRLDMITPANLWYVLLAFLHAVSPAAGTPALLVPVAVAVGLLAREVAPGGMRRWRGWIAGCLAWLALRVVFYAWFDPQNAFMWGIGTLPAIWLLFAPAVAAARRPRPARASALAVVLLVAAGTVGGLIVPAQGHAYAEEADRWRQATAKGDLILTNNYPLHMALKGLGEREAIFLPRALRSWWYGFTDATLRAYVAGRQEKAALYATGDVDDRQEIWTDFTAGPRARFERPVPLLYDAPRINAFIKAFPWYPTVIGVTAAGPMTAWRLEGRRGG